MTAQMVPDQAQMRRYLKRGLTQAQIVEAWKEDSGIRVSRSAIAMAISRYGLSSATTRARPRYEDTLPWRVKREHTNHYDARMLRLEGRRREGNPMTERELQMLAQWKKLLDERNAVVTYAPDTEQGFFWIERTVDDTDLIRRDWREPEGRGKGRGASSTG